VTGHDNTLQAAYGNAAEGETVQARELTFMEDLNLSLPKSVTLSGGYGPGFTTNTGVTTIAGSVALSGGPVTMESIVVQ